MTRSDYYILQALDEPDILEVQSPAIIAHNLDLTREYVSKRLGIFEDKNLVEKIEDGKYRISAKGAKFMAGEINTEELEE